ncbi:hypothetical protein [Burkholderia sp. F1]|uniref:hypothetical protein n=1 Tax=Burkholderia sp. F1 TaxID=3366817 RepID=UPI003D70DC1A
MPLSNPIPQDYKTSLVIDNATPHDISLSATYANASDWGSANKPAFQNIALPSRQSVSQELIVAGSAKSAVVVVTFTVSLDQQKSASIVAKINQCDAKSPPAALSDPDSKSAKDFLQIAEDCYLSDVVLYADVQCTPPNTFKLLQFVSSKDAAYLNGFTIVKN